MEYLEYSCRYSSKQGIKEAQFRLQQLLLKDHLQLWDEVQTTLIRCYVPSSRMQEKAFKSKKQQVALLVQLKSVRSSSSFHSRSWIAEHSIHLILILLAQSNDQSSSVEISGNVLSINLKSEVSGILYYFCSLVSSSSASIQKDISGLFHDSWNP